MYVAFVFVAGISFTSIEFAFEIITVTAELKCYSNINVISSVKSWVLWSREGAVGGEERGVLCQTGDIPVW